MSMPLAMSYFCCLMMAGNTAPSEGGVNTTIVTLEVSAASAAEPRTAAVKRVAMEIMALKIAATGVAARTIRQARADAFMIAPPIVLPAVFYPTNRRFRSSSPFCNKPCRSLEQCRIGAKRREGALGLIDQPKQLFLCLGDAENPNCGRFAGVRILPGCLPDGCGIALDVEKIIGDLEGFPDNGAEPVERHPSVLVCTAEDRSGEATITQQRAGLHRLQLLDIRQVESRRRRCKPAFRR